MPETQEMLHHYLKAHLTLKRETSYILFLSSLPAVHSDFDPIFLLLSKIKDFNESHLVAAGSVGRGNVVKWTIMDPMSSTSNSRIQH